MVAPSALPGLDAKENSPAQVDERNTRVGHLQAGFWEFAALKSCFNEILNLHNGDYGRSGDRRAGSMTGLAASMIHLNASNTCCGLASLVKAPSRSASSIAHANTYNSSSNESNSVRTTISSSSDRFSSAAR